MKISEKNISRKESITVEFFFKLTSEKFNIKLLSEKVGFERPIIQQNLHRPGLALAGFIDLFSYNRVQLFGNTEMRYLYKLSKKEREESLKRIFSFPIPCIIVTNNNEPTDELIKLANEYKVPVFGSEYTTNKLAFLITDLLDDQFAPRITLHGSFVDVYGIGMLFVGKSGIGKSEVALDLVERGHRLVADDVVIFTKKGEGILMGSGTDLAKHFMELRGIGIVNVQQIFGIRAIRFQKRLEIVIELALWDENETYTRTGLDNETIKIQDVEIPYLKLPIIPGKNITVIAEVIALNYLLKHYGYDSAKVFQKRLMDKLKNENKFDDERIIDYFEHDFE